MPARVNMACFVEHVFVGRHVFRPMFARLEIGIGKLPIFMRVGKPLAKTFRLLFLADVEKKFQQQDAVGYKHAFKINDFLATPLANFLRSDAENPFNEDRFVMRTVEDADVSVAGNGFVHAPEIIVCALFSGGHFEIGRLDTGGIDFLKNAFDGAILSARVEALEQEHDGPVAVGVEQFLQLADPLHQIGRFGLCLLLIPAAMKIRIEILDSNLSANHHRLIFHRAIRA